MGRALAIRTDKRFDGKAMRLLSDRQRGFVLAMLERNANPAMVMDAAQAAGYRANYGYYLMRDEAVLAALHEEAVKRLTGASLMGASVLLEIAQDETHKDRLKAAVRLTELNGFTPERKLTIEHVDRDSKKQLEEIKAWAKEMDLPISKVLPGIDIEDGEFLEVDNDND